MHAFDHHVVGQYQRFAAEFEHRAIVGQSARGGVFGQSFEGVDEGALVHTASLTIFVRPEPVEGRAWRDLRGLAGSPRTGKDYRTALDTASSTPLTNLASRASKKAWATSTYSLIAVPTGMSGRASNS